MTAPEIPEPVVAKMHAVLDAREGELRSALRAMLVEKTFPPHPRFRKIMPPPLDDGDRLLGVCFEYDFGVFVPVAHGLSRAGAFKCGTRRVMAFPKGPLFEAADLLYAQVVPDGFGVESERALCLAQMAMLEKWLCRMWRLERHAAAALRGFATLHESSEWRDLDSGEMVMAASLEWGPL
jgi:hypothetical protein